MNYSPANILMSLGNSLSIDIFNFKNLEQFKLCLRTIKF